jgi:tetratricopeptide (TPR) repeat protein
MRVWWILGAVLLAGLIVRLLYLSEISRRADFTHPEVDGAFHDYWAWGIASGEWAVPDDYPDPLIRERAYFRPPGYAYTLGAIYFIFGRDYLAPRVFQMLLGLASCFLAFLFARRWFGDRAGVVYSALTAFYWIFIYFEGKLLDAVVDVFFTVLLLLLLSDWMGKATFRSGLIRGAVLGLFALFRTNVLLFWPAALIWLWWSHRGGSDRKSIIRCAGGFLLGTLLALSPAFIRNAVVARDPVLVAANGGMSLAIGNNEKADGTNHYLPGYGMMKNPFDYTLALQALEKSLGETPSSLRYSEASRIFARRAFDYIRAHPLAFLKLTLRKAALFWGPYEVTNNEEIYFARKSSRVLSVIPLNFTSILALGIVGGIMFFTGYLRGSGLGGQRAGFRVQGSGIGGGAAFNGQRETCNGPFSNGRMPVAVLTLLFVGVYFLSALPFAAADRYRVPAIPGILLFSSLALLALFDFLRRKEWVRLMAATGGCVLAYFLFSINPAGYQPSPAKWHYDAGIAAAAEGRIEEAIAEYRRALEAIPDYTEARNNLGAILVRAGRWKEAVAEYQEVLRLRPDQAEMHSNLGDVLSRLGRDEEAIASFREALRLDPECVQAHNNLGIVLEKQGKRDEAADHYQSALRIQPDYEEAHYNLANLLGRSGDVEGAISHFREAIRFDPRYAPAHNNLGNALFGQGKLTEAAEEYRKALEVDPGLLDAHNNLANILAGSGQYDEAIVHYSRALEIDPNYGMAQLNLGYTLEVRGKRGEAIVRYRRARELMPVSVPAHLRLALALAAEGQKEEARGLVEKALILEPGSVAAKEAMEKIVISNQ